MAKLILILIITGVWLSPLLVLFFRQIKKPIGILKYFGLLLLIFPSIFILLVFVGLIFSASNRNIYTPYILQYVRDNFLVYSDWLAFWFMLPFLLFAVGNMIDIVFPKKHIQSCLPEVLALLISLVGLVWVPAWLTGVSISDVYYNRVSLFNPFYSPLRLSALWFKVYHLIYVYTGTPDFSMIISTLGVGGGFFQGFEYLMRMGGKVKNYRG